MKDFQANLIAFYFLKYSACDARSYKEIDGDPLNDPNRHTRVQVIEWNEDGTPHFGVPAPDNAPADPEKR